MRLPDNYDLWRRHDRLITEQEERYYRTNRIIDIAIEGIQDALDAMEDDPEEACEMLEDLIMRLEDER